MGQYLSNIFKLKILILCICAPLYFWGLAYEYSYFSILNLQVFDIFDAGIFSPLYYIFTSLIYILGSLLILIIMTQLFRLFSRDIEKDDWNHTKKTIGNSELNELIKIARISLIVSFTYWIYMILAIKYHLSTAVGGSFLFIIFLCICFSFPGIYKTNINGKTTLIVCLIISIGFCFSAGGIYGASKDLNKKGIIRDDFLVQVSSNGHDFKAKAKTVPIPSLSVIKNVLK